MVHADLGPLIDKYGNPGLMSAFHNNTVDKYMAHDEYFQKSSLVSLVTVSDPKSFFSVSN